MRGTIRRTIQLVSFILVLSVTPQIASATSIFKIQFDFTSAGAGVGSGYLDFAVDPDNLPFDTWIDLSDMTITASHLTLSASQYDAEFADFASLHNIHADLYITNNNPDFTVSFEPHYIELPYFMVAANTELCTNFTPDECDYELRMYTTGEFSLDASGFGSPAFLSGQWNATVGFDDPVPLGAVPIPSALWLFTPALAGLGVISRKRKGIKVT